MGPDESWDSYQTIRRVNPGERDGGCPGRGATDRAEDAVTGTGRRAPDGLHRPRLSGSARG